MSRDMAAAAPFDPRRHLARFLAEDVGRGDITGALLPRKRVSARIVSRERAVVAGTVHASEIFGLRGCDARILREDGSRTGPGQAVMEVTGDARDVLACERTALNLLARMSGIATQTSLLAARLPAGTALYSTRKTAPGLRHFDKEAVHIGGGMRHRLGLDRAVMIKDNHIAVAGRPLLAEMIRKARRRHGEVEVEVESVADAVLAAREGASTIMLDNFSPPEIRRAVRELKRHGLRDAVRLEASGGINAGNISRYGRTGVDMVSVGSITSAARGIDMSLEIV